MSALIDDIVLIEVNKTGLPGDGATVAEAAAWRAEVDAWEAQLASFGLDDLSDVDTTGAVTNSILTFDGTTWAPGARGNTVAVTDHGGLLSPGIDDLRILDIMDGLTVTSDDPFTGTPRARVGVKFAGTGTSYMAAHHNHWHWTDTVTRAEITPQGYMSSGTRALATANVTLLAGVNYLVEAEVKLQVRGADPGACYYRLNLTINGNTRSSGGGVNGFWSVQGVPQPQTTWDHEQTLMGGGAAITVSASITYDSGGGFYTDAGSLKVTLRPDR